MIEAMSISNFYPDPYTIRNYALEREYIDCPTGRQLYGDTCNHPGMRTKIGDGIKDAFVFDKISKHIEPIHGKIVEWDNEWNGLFQYCVSTDFTWVHTDMWSWWAAVLFLTPNPPIHTGTGFFRHRETGLYKSPAPMVGEEDNNYLLHTLNSDGDNWPKWEMYEEHSNQFNKMILYRGDYFHSSLRYFGKTIHDSRLFQTFFFRTEEPFNDG